MPKKTTTETRAKAAVGRERRLALALRALLDSLGNAAVSSAVDRENDEANTTVQNGVTVAEQEALALLTELGYKDLESIPKRVARLNAALEDALKRGDGGTIVVLGDELVRAQAGLPPKKAKAEAKVKAASE